MYYIFIAMQGPSRGSRRSSGASPAPAAAQEPSEAGEPKSWWKLQFFIGVLTFDSLISLTLLAPFVPYFGSLEELTTSHYTLHGNLTDLALVAIPRIATAVLSLLLGFGQTKEPARTSTNLYDENGDKKSKEDIENEALEEPVLEILKKLVWRMPFLTELSVLATGVLLCVKCLARLNVEIGVYGESHPHHPVFWMALLLTAMCSLLETMYTDHMQQLAGKLGRQRRRQQQQHTSWVDRIGETLATPLLLSRNNSQGNDNSNEEEEDDDDEARPITTPLVVVSDIGPDASYSAKWTDLLEICKPDALLIAVAFVFLILSSIAMILVPKYTGAVLDSLVDHMHDSNNSSTTTANSFLFAVDAEENGGSSIVQIPGFVRNIQLLALASILGGVFGGLRGAIFTLVGARVNTRLRMSLMDSLLAQEIGFYDTTRTGDISSRLSSDTTLVGMSVTTCVNIFLRSALMAVGYLIFMATISWQLSILSFVTIPAVSTLSKWYGRYLRKLSKVQQKKLADGSSVSEASISSMPTVKAFGAEKSELKEFGNCMENYLTLAMRSAIATLGFSTTINALPELVKALVLFYGGLLCQNNDITSGDLISFVLYLSSLSGAFNSLGGIYAVLVRAVGAADKVFELLNRKPKITAPSHIDPARIDAAVGQANSSNSTSTLLGGVKMTKVVEQRARGLHPETCEGRIEFRNVHSRYPARPDRVVLQGLNLTIQPGTVCALVGESGGGKSSIVKLIQALYEPYEGQVCIDGTSVTELSHDWLSRNVAVVSQEPTLFARSVKKNIIYGLEGTDAEPTDQEIEEAARLANAASFIEALPKGYDSNVGERGVQLSGGQKQRVAIARALVRKPRILLLDEATSALDSESEHIVQQALDNMITGQREDSLHSMTVIVIAHRLSTVRNADSIVVIDKGKVVEQGTHDELVNNNAAYNRLIRRQLGQSDDPATDGANYNDREKVDKK